MVTPFLDELLPFVAGVEALHGKFVDLYRQQSDGCPVPPFFHNTFLPACERLASRPGAGVVASKKPKRVTRLMPQSLRL